MHAFDPLLLPAHPEDIDAVLSCALRPRLLRVRVPPELAEKVAGHPLELLPVPRDRKLKLMIRRYGQSFS
jgi:hypothetical protein